MNNTHRYKGINLYCTDDGSQDSLYKYPYKDFHQIPKPSYSPIKNKIHVITYAYSISS